MTNATSWPSAPAPAVFHGAAGEFVLGTEPHTESDPMALLSQFLVAFGTTVGRSAHYAVEASQHHTNEFVVLVEAPRRATGRAASRPLEALLRDVDPDFVERCLASGMSSGEGLIAEVADRTDGELAINDKRKLIIEAEFAQVLKALAREGNTLSPVIRNAWDGKTLQAMTRNSPLRATGAHIGVVAHVTKDELLRHINGTTRQRLLQP